MKSVIKRISFGVVLGLMMIQGLKASSIQLRQLNEIFEKDDWTRLASFINANPTFNWNGQYNVTLITPWQKAKHETVTPIIAATIHGAPRCVKVLVHIPGIQPSLKSSHGYTALQYAQDPKRNVTKKSNEVVEQLLWFEKYKATPKFSNKAPTATPAPIVVPAGQTIASLSVGLVWGDGSATGAPVITLTPSEIARLNQLLGKPGIIAQFKEHNNTNFVIGTKAEFPIKHLYVHGSGFGISYSLSDAPNTMLSSDNVLTGHSIAITQK